MSTSSITRKPWLAFALATLAILATTASGCGKEGASSTAGPATSGSAAKRDVQASDFAKAKFDRSTTIDNKWFPLKPGTQLHYMGSSVEDGQRLHHRVVFTITDMTKVIDGIEAVVAWDRDYTTGKLVEEELVFFAQDNDGNVWHLGQYPEVFENGKLVETPAWITGLKGARAGVFVRANPRLGSSDYSQGFAPKPINWIDRARVYKTGVHTCVPAGCFDDVTVLEEFELDKPDAFQLKYHAPGVGDVRVGWRGAGEDTRETLVLERIVHLDADGLAEARAEAMRLEARAYRFSKYVYGQTEPAS
jgi:hypothetical protein